MEVIVKVRLLLTSALLMFVQIPAPQAQVTVDVSKITCEQYFFNTITFSQYIVFWISGYYNGERHNTIIDPDTLKKNEAKVNLYCNQHREMTVMDAVKNVLGFEK
jgi:acid stress chaperone HdeB